MKPEIIKAVERYQCPGCVCGSDISCYIKSERGIGCSKHAPGTMLGPETGFASLFLGMPKGFCRTGPLTKRPEERLRVLIFSTWKQKYQEWGAYDKFNVTVWIHEAPGTPETVHTFIRGLSPRINLPFLHLVLEPLTNNVYETIDKKAIIRGSDLKEMD